MARPRKGDPQAEELFSVKEVAEWLSDHRGYLYTIARSHADTWDEIDDLTHEIVLHLLSYRRSTRHIEFDRWVRANVTFAIRKYYTNKKQYGWSNPEPIDTYRSAAIGKPDNVQDDFEQLPYWDMFTDDEKLAIKLRDRGLTSREMFKLTNHYQEWFANRLASAAAKLRPYLTPED